MKIRVIEVPVAIQMIERLLNAPDSVTHSSQTLNKIDLIATGW